MKATYIFRILFFAAITLLYGCTNPVKEVKERMADNYHLHMNQYVALINSSLENVHSIVYVDSATKKTVSSSSSLKKIIKKKFFRAIPSAIFQFELSSIGNDKISLKQYNEARNYTLQIIKDSLNLHIRYKDKKVITSLVDSILTSYTEQFSVNIAYSYYKEQRDYSGTFLQFLETENEGYCNDNNLLPGDCNWGYIFLSANGKSVFKFECVGSDSIQYNVGNYEKKLDTLVCSFKNSYSYLENYDKNTGVSISNPNEGKMSKEGKFNLELLPCECIQYPFIIRYMNEEGGNNRLQTYVVKVATFKEQDNFIKSIRNIKVIAKMIKN